MPARRLAGSLAVTAVAVAAGITAPVAVAAPGALDTSFGTGGVTVSNIKAGGLTIAASMAIAPNGDIYQAGTTEDASSNTELYVARFLPNGTLDASFGVGGFSAQQIGQGPKKSSGGAVIQPQRIAITPSGDIVVPTSASDAAGNTQIAVAEFTPAGALDTSFAAGGPMPGVYYDDTTSTPDTSTALLTVAAADSAVVQSDGKIVFDASAEPASGPETFVRRLNANGTVDTGFATGGTYTGPASSATVASQINDLTLNSAGDVVFTGGSPGAGGASAIILGELNPDGSVPSGWPKLFQASTVATPSSFGLVVYQAANGDYIVGGDSTVAENLSLGQLQQGWIAAAFTPGGAIDTTFGSGGSGVAVLLPGSESPYALVQQADGRLVFTGATGVLGGGLVLVRTLANGTLDPSFGSAGVESYSLGSNAAAEANSLAITSDGRLIVGGWSFSGTLTSGDATLAKIILDAPPTLVVTAGPAIAGQPVSFSATTQSDSAVTSIKWDLGSGSFTDATGATATKTFATPGTYTVRAQATDADQQSSIVTDTVTVAAAQTVTTPTPLPANECTSSTQPTATITTKLISPRGLIIAGTAAAHCPSQVQTVKVAVARVKKKKCSFLSASHRWGKYGSCTPTTFVAASGTYSWGLGLKRKFARGTYWLWPRVTDDHAVSTATAASGHTALKLS